MACKGLYIQRVCGRKGEKGGEGRECESEASGNKRTENRRERTKRQYVYDEQNKEKNKRKPENHHRHILLSHFTRAKGGKMHGCGS